MRILHFIGAAVGGILAGGVVIALIEGISSFVYPMPEGLNLNDHEAMAGFVDTLPVGAFLFVLVAWSFGLLIAGYVARRIAPQRSARPAWIACGFLFLGAIFTLFMIPHPVWFWFAGTAACPVFGLAGMVLASPSSCSVQTSRMIQAPIEVVFRTLATIEEFSKAVPGIVKVEFLTDQHYGVGTRFRETRIMHGKEAATVLEVSELVENRQIRLVSDAGGTTWDTVFRVTQRSGEVEMQMHMDARPHNILARAITPLIMGIVCRACEQDMDSVKKYCETAT